MSILDDINWEAWAWKAGAVLLIAGVIGGLVYAIHEKDKTITSQATVNGQLTTDNSILVDNSNKAASSSSATNTVVASSVADTSVIGKTQTQINTDTQTKVDVINKQYNNLPPASSPAAASAADEARQKALAQVQINSVWESYCVDPDQASNPKCAAYRPAAASAASAAN